MIVFIPLHQACTHYAGNPENAYIPVLSDMPLVEKDDETYLTLETDHESVDFGLTIGQGGASVMAIPALHHAKRLYDDVILTNAEDYSERGKAIAESLYFGSAIEFLAAWINEDRQQADLAQNIHAVLSLNILPKLPQWVRHDIFLMLESESMKQIFATRYFTAEKEKPTPVSTPPELRNALRDSANDKTDPLLSTLMAETMQTPLIYNGCAGRFYDQATKRVKAFRAL